MNIISAISNKFPFLKKLTYTHWFWIILSFVTLIKIPLISNLGLNIDEAYYWIWSKNLSLSYYDHPPLIAYFIYLSTSIFGDNQFSVRLPALTVLYLISVLIFYLAKVSFNEKIAFWTIILLNCVPQFSVSFLLITPDVPLFLFWILFIVVFWKLIETSKANYWYLLGFILGFGLLSKYTSILLIPSVLLFLIISPKHRFWFLKKEPYVALIIALIVFSPVVFWNIENNFASFGFQFPRVLLNKQFNINPLLKFISQLFSQAEYISPFMILIYWYALFWSIYKYYKIRKTIYLIVFCFSFITFAFFNYVLISGGNYFSRWLAIAYLPLTIIVIDLIIKKWGNNLFRKYIIFSWLIALICTLLGIAQAYYKIIPAEYFISKKSNSLINGISRSEIIDKTNEYFGLPEIANKIAGLMNNSNSYFIFSNKYGLSSQLFFYLKKRQKVYCLNDWVDGYDFFQQDITSLNGKDGIFVTDNSKNFLNPVNVFPFESWKKPEVVEIFRKGRKIRIYWLYFGKNFQLDKLDPKYTSAIIGPKRTIKEGLADLWDKTLKIFRKG